MASTLEALLLAQQAFLLNPPLVRATQVTPQSIPNTTVTALTYDGSTVDTYNMHSTVTNNSRATAVIAGWYYVTARVLFAASNTGDRNITLRLNGTTYFGGTGGPSSSTAINTTMMAADYVFMNIGDYVEAVTYQTSGGALSTSASAPGCALSVLFVHA